MITVAGGILLAVGALIVIALALSWLGSWVNEISTVWEHSPGVQRRRREALEAASKRPLYPSGYQTLADWEKANSAS